MRFRFSLMRYVDNYKELQMPLGHQLRGVYLAFNVRVPLLQFTI